MASIIRSKKIIASLLVCAISFGAGITTSAFGKGFNQVEQLFIVRAAITEQGNVLPDSIKNATGNDVRTLERIFELNTSSLTTIEAYFRILMIALATGSEKDTKIVEILNGWLTFIYNQCSYDIEYLEEALIETTDENILAQITSAKNNSEKLSEIVMKSIEENAGRIKSK